MTHNLLHSATPSYLYRFLNIQPTRPTRFSNCLCLAHPKLTSRLKFSDLFRMLHLLFGTNYSPPFVPFPQKQPVPTQCHFHHLATHANPVLFPPPFVPSPQKQPVPTQCLAHHCLISSTIS